MHEKDIVCFALLFGFGWGLFCFVFLKIELVNFHSRYILICKQLPQEQGAYLCSPATVLDTPDFTVI